MDESQPHREPEGQREGHKSSGEGDFADLDEAVTAFRLALAAAAPGDPQRPTILRNLGMALLDRSRAGDLESLDEAVAVLSEAVAALNEALERMREDRRDWRSNLQPEQAREFLVREQVALESSLREQAALELLVRKQVALELRLRRQVVQAESSYASRRAKAERRVWSILVLLGTTWGAVTLLAFNRMDFSLHPATALFGCFAVLVLMATVLVHESDR